MWPGDDNPDWWPPHVQAILAAIGQAMGDRRLYPETLKSIPSRFGSILSDHHVIIEHVSGKDIGSRKGRYRITVEGPAFAGQWGFRSGQSFQGLLQKRKRPPTEGNYLALKPKTRTALTGCVVLIMVAVFFYGVGRYPDAPIHPCVEGRNYLIKYHPDGYCGKQGQPRTADEYHAFEIWQTTFLIIWPLGMGALFILRRIWPNP